MQRPPEDSPSGAAAATSSNVVVTSLLRFRPLPGFLTGVVGRDREVNELQSLIARDDCRLVTLTGPGGVGKTRLAVFVAETLQDHFAAGISFVSLSSLADPNQLMLAIGHALGIRDATIAQILNRIEAVCESRTMLLVTDNMEHLLAGAADLSELIKRCPGLTILATSRAPLSVTGERVYPLAPLSTSNSDTPVDGVDSGVSDSAKLFLERALAISPGFKLNADNVDAVQEIVQRLDGLPLAIELASTKIRILTPRRLLNMLDRRFEILTEGPGDFPDRHRSLRLAMAWSYDMLTPEQQTFFRRISVFHGAVSLDAAEAIGSEIGLDALDAVYALVNQSLLLALEAGHSTIRHEPRYVMLSTIREYGIEQLKLLGEYESAVQEHAQYVLTLVERVQVELEVSQGPEQQSLDLLDVERQNIEGALQHFERTDQYGALLRLVGAMSPYWFTKSVLLDGSSWVNKALRSGDDVPIEHRARAMIGGGLISIEMGDFAFSLESLFSGCELAAEAESLPLLAKGKFGIGVVYQDQGRAAEAIPFFEEALDAARRSSMTVFSATVLSNLGLVMARAGDLAKGEAMLEQAVEEHRRVDYPYGAALAQRFLGQVLMKMGRLAEAKEQYALSLSIPPDEMQAWHIANALEGLAIAAEAERSAEISVQLFGAADKVRSVYGVPLEPALVDDYAMIYGRLRARLGDAAFSEHWLVGQNMETVDAIEAGLTFAASTVASDSLDPEIEGKPVNDFNLTPREREVLALMAEGRSNAEIADALFMSPRTAGVHVSHVLAKLSVDNRSAAVSVALKNGLA